MNEELFYENVIFVGTKFQRWDMTERNTNKRCGWEKGADMYIDTISVIKARGLMSFRGPFRRFKLVESLIRMDWMDNIVE